MIQPKKPNFNVTRRRILLVGLGGLAVVAGIAKIGHQKTHHLKHITLKTGTLGNLDPDSIKDTHRLRITPISLEIAKGLILPTIGYDGGSLPARYCGCVLASQQHWKSLMNQRIPKQYTYTHNIYCQK